MLTSLAFLHAAVAAIVVNLSDADPTKCYSVTTMGRGGWAVDAAGTMLTCTNAEGLTVDDTDARQQFAILSLNGEDYYLYSVSAKKFVAMNRALVAGKTDAIELVDASSMGEGRVLVRFDANHNINVAGSNLVIDAWSYLDAGNAVAILEAGDFDASEALAMLAAEPEEEEEFACEIVYPRGPEGWIEGADWHNVDMSVMGYSSPIYHFAGKVETFRIIVKGSKNNQAFFCLSELELYDADGQKIPLTAANVASNADHNTLNPESLDGGGFAALFDEDLNTYFHSAWQNMPIGEHYLEVTLPDGGYDTFSFTMLSRSNSGGRDQSHTFPGEMALVSSVELSSIEIPEVPEIPGDDDEPVESVTSLSDADPTKCYSISTTTRGAWAVDDAGTHFSTTGVEGYEVNAEDARQQFAILSANGDDYYLYSVSAKKFVKRDRTLVAGAADAIEFVDASSIGEGRVLVRFRDLANSNINIGGDNQMVINSWGVIDAGNAVLIAEAGDFDAAEALAMLLDPEAAELNALIAQVEQLVASNADNHAAEPMLGQYSTAAYDALVAAVGADSVSKYSLEAAIEAFEVSKCLPVFTIDGVYDYVDGMSIYESTYDNLLHWKETDRKDRSMLWVFNMTDTVVGVTDKVEVKNLATGNRFEKAFFLQITETNDSIAEEGVFLIYPEGMGLPSYAERNGRVTRGNAWLANSPAAWRFTYAGTTYGINELPDAPDTPDAPVVTDTMMASMPLVYEPGELGWIEGTEWYNEDKGIAGFTSPLYLFDEKIETFRIVVKRTQFGEKFFCLSELEFFDAHGQKIPLTEANVASNADHNALNPDNLDGGGLAALFDADTKTYFHSAWQNIPEGDHYLEVTLPNGGYDAFSFRMLSRGREGAVNQSRTFPAVMVIANAFQREALRALLQQADAINTWQFPEVGYQDYDFTRLNQVVSEAIALVENKGSEAECEAMIAELSAVLEEYEQQAAYILPEPGKPYRIISAFSDFVDYQMVEKALTINTETNGLWWEDACAGNPLQEFVFEPVLDESGAQRVEVLRVSYNNELEVMETHYLYRMKNVATGLYVTITDEAGYHVAEEPCETRLMPLGYGQFNIKNLIPREVGGSVCTVHAGDHNGGRPGNSAGAYGGTYGIGSGIVSWAGGIDTPSAWFIREAHELPHTIPVSAGEFKSGFFHFDATDVITLTTDVPYSFDNLLWFYDAYGYYVEVNDKQISGNTTTITLERKVTSCAFVIDNYEGVSSITFNAEAQVEEPDIVPSLEMIFAYPQSDVPVSRADFVKLLFNKEVTLALPEEGIVVRGATTGAEFTVREGHVIEDMNGWHVLLYFLDEKGAYDAVDVADTYTYTIPAGVIQSVDGEEYPETTFTFSIYETFPLISYYPTECSVLETIVLTFDRAVTEVVMPTEGLTVTDIYSTPVAKVKHDVIISEDMKTVTLELESPITTPGWYYLSLYTGVFLDEQGMGNSYEGLVFEVYEDTSSDPILGDVNSDGQLTMMDVVMQVNAVLNISQEGYDSSVADMNGDGEISIVDVVAVLRLVLGYEPVAAAREMNREASVVTLEAGDVSIAADGAMMLPIYMNNTAAYTAFQVDVVLPEGMTLSDAVLGERAKSSHSMSWSTLENGATRIVAYAMNNATFRDNDEALMYLTLQPSPMVADDAVLTLADGRFATTHGGEDRADDAAVMMRSETTSVAQLSGEARISGADDAIVVETAAAIVVNIYSLTGQQLKSIAVEAGTSTIAIPAGVYVVNGQKIIVK